MNNKIPALLLISYLALFTICAIAPYDRSVWWAENIPVMVIVALLVLTWRRHRFSDGAYILMSVFLLLHTIGGHYTFERVPFGWVSQLFGFERNHYDRLAHFSVGFYAYAMAELLLVKALVRSKLILHLFPVFAIVTVAGAYEIFEWLYAVSADPAAGMAVLGSQGDIWDAQKDILSDTLGAILAMSVFSGLYRQQLNRLVESNGD